MKQDMIAVMALGSTRNTDVARAVRFLASDDAGFVTGQILGVDGAMVI